MLDDVLIFNVNFFLIGLNDANTNKLYNTTARDSAIRQKKKFTSYVSENWSKNRYFREARI